LASIPIGIRAWEHLTFVKSLVKPHPNPLLGKEREQESGVFAKLRCSLRALGISYFFPASPHSPLPIPYKRMGNGGLDF